MILVVEGESGILRAYRPNDEDNIVYKSRFSADGVNDVDFILAVTKTKKTDGTHIWQLQLESELE